MKIECVRHTKYYERLLIDQFSYQLTFIDYSQNTKEQKEESFNGIYDYLGEHFLALFKDWNHKIILILDDKWLPISTIKNISYRRNSNLDTFSIISEDNAYEVQYQADSIPEKCSVFWSEDDEDVNFGLWLSNVLNSIERKKIIAENW